VLAAIGIGLGLVLAIACGDDPRVLRHASLDHQGLIIFVFLVQSVARGVGASFLGAWSVVVWGFCSIALLMLVARQWDNAGLTIAATGIGTNALVILLNGGMPVVPPPGAVTESIDAIASSQGFYQLANASTHLAFLGDVIPAGVGVASVGDVLLALGATLFIVIETSRLSGLLPHTTIAQ